MNNDPRKQNSWPARPDPEWSDIELFCIHSYAGESGPPCGWRGQSRELSRGTPAAARRCPRCGRATLMELPSRRSDEP